MHAHGIIINLSSFFSSRANSGLLRPFMSSFCINQLYYSKHRSVVSLFCLASEYSKKTLLAHSVARLALRRHLTFWSYTIPTYFFNLFSCFYIILCTLSCYRMLLTSAYLILELIEYVPHTCTCDWPLAQI